MKKLTAILLAVLALTSCTAATEIDIAEGLETYREAYTESGRETEVPYTPPEEIQTEDTTTQWGGIFSPDFTVSGGKYYFETRRSESRGNSVSMIAYTDLATGNSGILCPDPLCTHQSAEVCKYADLQGIYFTDEEGVFYSCRHTFTTTIYRVDVNNDTVQTACEINSFNVNLLGYDNGKLYFYELKFGMEGRTAGISYLISCLDTDTGKVTELGYIPDEWALALNLILFVRNDEIYFTAYSSKLMKTDLSLTNVIEVIAADPWQWYWDEGTDALYFSTSDPEKQTGSVYVHKDGKTEQIPLPHENIHAFTMTEDRIYYSPYDPVFYGFSNVAFYFEDDPEEHKVYDYTGGKVYAVDRDNPSAEAELVYEASVIDGNRMADLDNCAVFGDYLYFNEITVRREVLGGVEFVTFSLADDVSKIRVGLKDGSFTRISFD